MLLAGKSALITGAANRIGAQIARTLHENGANLIIHYRDSITAATELQQLLNNSRADSAITLACELNDTEELQTLSQDAAAAFNGLDILINNASSFYPAAIGEITQQHWDSLLSSNFKAPLFLSQACYPWLRESRGVIINMLDIYATTPLKNHSLYCSAKAANQMLVKSLALDLAPEVRVNGIAPGAILWPQQNRVAELEVQRKITAQIPLQRTGTPQSIAQTVLFLISNDYVTGEVIRVDGGRLLQSFEI
ncbi:MAG: pteridine reductase [Gammaproteobacteria bacterium]|nr:pteridine reductase [Gammaproteobacteria bacterium]